jgi:hypothetical protein
MINGVDVTQEPMEKQQMLTPPPPTAGRPGLGKPLEPTPEERTILAAHVARRKRKRPSPRLKLTEKAGSTELSTDHPIPHLGNALIMDSLATADPDFFDGLLCQLVNVGAKGKIPDERGTNFLLAMVRGIDPRDEVEAMIATQMAAVHVATMTFARHLAQANNIVQRDSAERTFNKLARTFAVQLESLKRYRTGGEQKVTVQHVTVNEGGQAIVGSVSPAMGGVGDVGKN